MFMLSRLHKRGLTRTLRGLRGLASVANSGKYPIGQEIAGYEVSRVQAVPEFNLTAVELTHKFSGSKHLHIDRQDRNNVFGVIVKTNPPDDSGLPHILEHTTLCGSEKFPVKDPFFKMLNRSLANFMNAMTGQDYTYFPFATTNSVDYNNLMDVYLDAVFHPLLAAEDFRQEGWRIEHEDPHDKSTPFKFKGVVYNEMKGQMSDPSYYFWIHFQQSIYPSLHISGGNPAKITTTYYDDLKRFQGSHYHPSNCYTYTYGALPLERSLEKVDKAIKTYGKRHRRNIVKQPIKLNEVKKVEISGPIDPMMPEHQQYKSSMTWLTGSPTDVYESFLLKMLSTLLMDGHSSPLYQKLVESGVGTDFSANTGMDSMAAANVFTVGLNGLTKEASEQLEQTVLQALEDVKKEGVDDTRVKGILHQIEIGRRIESADFGLSLLSSLAPGIVDDVDPLEALKFDEVVNRFKAEYAEKGDGVFVDLIDKYLLSRPYLKYSVAPDATVPEQLQNEEKERLEGLVKRMSGGDRLVIYNKGIELAKFQEAREKDEDVTCLPTLHTSDISRDGQFVRLKEKSKHGLTIQTHPSPKTNGVTYFRALKSLTASELPPELVPYLPLFTSCLTNLGTHERSISDIENDVKLYTGGIGSDAFVHGSALTTGEAYLKFGIDGACLDANVPQMLSLWQQVLLDTDFHNIAKLETLVKSMVGDNLSSIVSEGHSFASSYGSAQLSTVGSLRESLSGIKQVQFLSELAKTLQKGALESEVVPKLEQIAQIVTSGSSKFKYGLTCSRDTVSENESQVTKFDGLFGDAKEFDMTPYELNSATAPLKPTFVEIPSQTNFASSTVRGPEYTSKQAAALQILAQLSTFKYLHKHIREQGGAYGGGATYDALNGLYSFYSYRDPNPVASLKRFESSVGEINRMIQAGEITASDLEQAKLTVFQKIDAPISVRSEGMTYFNYDIDDDVRQERRENLLDCSLEDVTEATETFVDQPKAEVIIGHDNNGVPDWDVVRLE